MMDDMWDQGLNDDSSKIRLKWSWWFQKILEKFIDQGHNMYKFCKLLSIL
jgi:hypothetical protein